jgi:uncharacterized protein DUF2771
VRRILTFAVVSAALAVAGCGAPQPPQVSFFANGTTIEVDPTQYCQPDADQCEPKDPASLRVPAGKPLVISVPSQVADATWAAVFEYRAADGSAQQGRTPVFAAGTQHAYTLSMPTAADQLTKIEVQRIASLVPDPQGGIAFGADASWVVNISS